MANASLTDIYNQLHGVSAYHPLSANTYADWTLEAGDKVKVVRDGQEYTVPVQTANLVWRGKHQMSIESPGKKERDTIAKVSAEKYGRGGSGVRASGEMYRTIEDEHGNTLALIAYTATSLTIGYQTADGNLSSLIEQTATQIRTEVKNTTDGLRSSINQTASAVSVVVEKVDGVNVVKRSAIVAAINGNETTAAIEADKIYLGGTTTLGSTLVLSDDGMTVTKDTYIGTTDNHAIRLYIVSTESGMPAGGLIATKNYSVDSGGGIKFKGGNYILTSDVLATMIETVSQVGNTLYLTQFNGTTVNFSKAVTSMTGSWSDGTLTVIPEPQGTPAYVRSLVQDTTTWDGNTAYVPIKAEYSDGGSTYYEQTGRNAVVDASGRYNAGYDSARLSLVWGTASDNTENRVTIAKTKTTSGSETFPKNLYITTDATIAYTNTANTAYIYATPKAYCDGSLRKTGNTVSVHDENLIASNIISGKTIFGVDGSHTCPTASHTVSSFNTTSPYGESYTVPGTSTTYTNSTKVGDDAGYYISSNKRDATIAIVVKGTWTCDGVSRNKLSWLQGAPKAIYQKGWDNGKAGGYEKSVTLRYLGYINDVYTYTTTTYVKDLTVNSRYTMHFDT